MSLELHILYTEEYRQEHHDGQKAEPVPDSEAVDIILPGLHFSQTRHPIGQAEPMNQ